MTLRQIEPKNNLEIRKCTLITANLYISTFTFLDWYSLRSQPFSFGFGAKKDRGVLAAGRKEREPKKCAIFSPYLTLAPRALLRNRTETLATHVMIDSSLMLTVAKPLSFYVLSVASPVFFYSDKRSSYCANGLFHEKRGKAREDGEKVRKKGRRNVWE